MKPGIAVLASGSGSNFQALIQAEREGKLRGRIVGLLAGKPGIGAIDRARQAGIPWHVIPSHAQGSSSQADPSDWMLQCLREWNTRLVVLAGYLRKVPDPVLEAYPDAVINIHPSLLPRHGGKGFYGLHVHQAVLDAGDTETGCTVHLVNSQYDSGPVLATSRMPVSPSTTASELAARVLRLEHELLPAVVDQHLHRLEEG